MNKNRERAADAEARKSHVGSELNAMLTEWLGAAKGGNLTLEHVEKSESAWDARNRSSQSLGFAEKDDLFTAANHEAVLQYAEALKRMRSKNRGRSSYDSSSDSAQS